MPINIKRLQHLVEILRKPLPKWKGKDIQFNLDSFGRMNCNTTACACGLAAMDPKFRKMGLSYKLDTVGDTDAMLEGVLTMHLKYKGLRNIDAAQKFFGLETSEQFSYLFIDDSYSRGNQYDVAQRIEKFIRHVEQNKRLVFVGPAYSYRSCSYSYDIILSGAPATR